MGGEFYETMNGGYILNIISHHHMFEWLVRIQILLLLSEEFLSHNYIFTFAN